MSTAKFSHQDASLGNPLDAETAKKCIKYTVLEKSRHFFARWTINLIANPIANAFKKKVVQTIQPWKDTKLAWRQSNMWNKASLGA